jgi:hypothetical protein
MRKLTPYVGGRTITGPDISAVVLIITDKTTGIALPAIPFNSVAEAGAYVSRFPAKLSLTHMITLRYTVQETINGH